MQRDEDGAFAAGAVSLTGLTVSPNGIVATGNYNVGPLAPPGSGVRMVWNPRKAAFRAGQVDGAATAAWNDENIGFNSVAMGTNTMARGEGSFAVGSFAEALGTVAISMGLGSIASGGRAIAMGREAEATADEAIAMGYSTVSSALGATALGFNATASGIGSTSIGANTTASADGALALGVGTLASGTGSVAIGSFASTAGYTGAIVIGDRSNESSNLVPTAANQFLVRAAGGYTLYSNSLMTAGVELTPGSGTWATLSDRNRKHDFRALDGDQVLARIRSMPIEEWSYISEGNEVRHVGPTAQDFRAAFGLGTNDRTITTVDIDGINLFAVQQLIERYEALKAEHAALRNEVNDLRSRLERLERLLDKP